MATAFFRTAGESLSDMAADTSQQISVIKDKHCSLLEKMPPEIRERIFVYAVIVREDCHFPWKKDKSIEGSSYTNSAFAIVHERDGKTITRATALGLTCHQIYEEVVNANLYFRHNSFWFFGPLSAVKFLRRLTPAQSRCIESIFLQWSESQRINATQALNIISNCHGLKHIRLALHGSFTPVMPEFEALCRVRGLKSLITDHWYKEWTPRSLYTRRQLSLIKDQAGRERIKNLNVWSGAMAARKITMQPRTKQSNKVAAAAAAIECYCESPRVLRFGRGKACHCQEPKHPTLSEEEKESSDQGIVSGIWSCSGCTRPLFH
jgi:hypothetical protein